MIRKDQVFRMFFDNRREIIETDELKGPNKFDLSSTLLDSRPLKNVGHCLTLRFISKFPITLPFNKLAANKTHSAYKTKIGIAVRTLIRGYYSKTETFGLKGTEFMRAKDVISFISGTRSTNDKLPTPQSISNLKNRNLVLRPVPRSDATERFAHLVKAEYPYFRDDLFLAKKVE
jgi:hypothetical protein